LALALWALWAVLPPGSQYVHPSERDVHPSSWDVHLSERDVLPDEWYIHPNERYVLPGVRYVLTGQFQAQPPEGGAAALDAVLDSAALTWGEAAGFILAAAGKGEYSGEDAFGALAAMTALPRKAESGGPVSLGGVSLIIMKAFDISGGLYRFFPNGHYAYRELVYLGIIQGRSDPDMKVSGERLLQILGRALDYTGFDRVANDV
jgi:hypothetical protein